MQLEEILSALENHTGIFPRLAVERAIEEREAITPLLLATLAECNKNLEVLLDKPDYMLHLYAMFLLAQFREPQAYPLITEFFAAPGDIALDATGDVVTEYLARILASVSHENIEPIKQLIENQAANEYVRGAALKSLVVLVVEGIISREEVIQYYEELFVTKLEKEPTSSYIWSDLVVNSASLCPIELKEYIDRAYEQDLIESFFIDEEDVNECIEMGVGDCLDKLLNNSHYSLIDNTIKEMERWASFQPKKLNKKENFDGLIEGFIPSAKHNKEKSAKKKKMQKDSRRKNRAKKK
ncbi:DUF1186 domain-containing protein [Anabaena cylindrica UHCC 0172]|uniref:DUF1186 domain-containing protein n=1 Tax=Anabaena cylindrica TaxID=1165 RepID=UPI002B1EC267|nr:DUF1186 domain-containing protein [Anabaena cylindrica]MEA5549848.1 DUF1186 domain-containing protein [Anabaena cylindrica UHCC 0172]